MKQVYVLTPNQELQAVAFTLREDVIEFMAEELGTYAIVYQSDSSEQVEPTVSERREPNKPVSESSSPRKTGDTLMSVPNSKQDQASQRQLPKTNQEQRPYLLFLAGLSLVLTASFVGKKEQV